MAEVKTDSSVSIKVSVNLKLSEQEARALHMMTVYGPNMFLQWFYKNLGKAYLKPHEDGLISLFNVIKKELPSQLDRVDKIREAVSKV